jgi:hypothetical protein
LSGFFADLSSVPTSGSLLEKLILIKPVVLAIRISFIVIAFGVVGFVALAFWKGIGIRKIGKEGVEFGKVDEISNKTQNDLAAGEAKIKELEERNKKLRKQNDELQESIAKILSSMPEDEK